VHGVGEDDAARLSRAVGVGPAAARQQGQQQESDEENGSLGRMA
jgi:hypothetical protein